MQFGLMAADTWTLGMSFTAVFAHLLSSLWLVGVIWLVMTGGKSGKLFKIRIEIRILVTLSLGALLSLSLAEGGSGYAALPGGAGWALLLINIAFPRLEAITKIQSAFCAVAGLIFGSWVIRSAVLHTLLGFDVGVHVLGGPNPWLIFLAAGLLGLVLGWLCNNWGIRLPPSNRWIASALHLLMPGSGLVYLGFFVYGPLLMVLEPGGIYAIQASLSGLGRAGIYLATALFHLIVSLAHILLYKKIIALREPAIFLEAGDTRSSA